MSRIKVADTDGSAIFGRWQAALLLGATSEILASTPDLHDAVSGDTVDAELPDGTIVNGIDEGGTGHIASGQTYGNGASDDELRDIVASKLKSYDLKPTLVSVFHPLQSAVAIYVAVPNPGVLTGRVGNIISSLSSAPIMFEGVYIEFDRADSRTPFSIQAVAYRTGESMNWSSPDFDNGVPHGGVPKAVPTS